MKKDTEYMEFMWPMRHFLITCGDIETGSNIIAVSFCMPVSKDPPLIACAIGKNAFSRTLIDKTGEFIVNVPSHELKRAIYYCGFHSGYTADKFKEAGLTAESARKVKAPVISECIAHMECRVTQTLETGDKILFVGEVIEAYADESLINDKGKAVFAQGDFPEKVYGTRFKKNRPDKLL
jgi:flavin reductase (DIM6/NTAB) family NADH-FMN oxidoreductase RutF